jgi:hypothetical protein
MSCSVMNCRSAVSGITGTEVQGQRLSFTRGVPGQKIHQVRSSRGTRGHTGSTWPRLAWSLRKHNTVPHKHIRGSGPIKLTPDFFPCPHREVRRVVHGQKIQQVRSRGETRGNTGPTWPRQSHNSTCLHTDNEGIGDKKRTAKI